MEEVEVVEQVGEQVVVVVEEVVNEEAANPNDEVLASLEQREAELWGRMVSMTLKENNLEMFADFIAVGDDNELAEAVKKLTQIVNDIKISISYQPVDNQKQDAYTVAKEQGNTKSMIKTLLNRK